MKVKEVFAGESENEFDVDDPDEVEEYSEDEWAPSVAVKTPGKRKRQLRNTSARRKTAKTTDEEDEDDEDEGDEDKDGEDEDEDDEIEDDEDDDEEEIIPPKKRGPKPKKPASTKGRERALKTKAKKELEDIKEEVIIVEDEEEEEENDEDEEEEEETFNQGPNDKPSEEFTPGAFVVLKTDMIGEGDPLVWKIDGESLLKKYIPFEQDGKKLYKNTSVYSGWGPIVKELYYSAPVSFIQHSDKGHIIEFFKDKIEKDPAVEEDLKKEMEDVEAELRAADIDSEEEDEEEEEEVEEEEEEEEEEDDEEEEEEEEEDEEEQDEV